MVAVTLVLILIAGAGYYLYTKDKARGSAPGPRVSPPRATKQD